MYIFKGHGAPQTQPFPKKIPSQKTTTNNQILLRENKNMNIFKGHGAPQTQPFPNNRKNLLEKK